MPRDTVEPRSKALTIQLQALRIATIASLSLTSLHKKLALLFDAITNRHRLFKLLFFSRVLPLIPHLIHLNMLNTKAALHTIKFLAVAKIKVFWSPWSRRSVVDSEWWWLQLWFPEFKSVELYLGTILKTEHSRFVNFCGYNPWWGKFSLARWLDLKYFIIFNTIRSALSIFIMHFFSKFLRFIQFSFISILLNLFLHHFNLLCEI